jgi:hypothetical protein
MSSGKRLLPAILACAGSLTAWAGHEIPELDAESVSGRTARAFYQRALADAEAAVASAGCAPELESRLAELTRSLPRRTRPGEAVEPALAVGTQAARGPRLDPGCAERTQRAASLVAGLALFLRDDERVHQQSLPLLRAAACGQGANPRRSDYFLHAPCAEGDDPVRTVAARLIAESHAQHMAHVAREHAAHQEAAREISQILYRFTAAFPPGHADGDVLYRYAFHAAGVSAGIDLKAASLALSRRERGGDATPGEGLAEEQRARALGSGKLRSATELRGSAAAAVARRLGDASLGIARALVAPGGPLNRDFCRQVGRAERLWPEADWKALRERCETAP